MAGRGSGADSSAASLEEDINRTIAGLKAIRLMISGLSILVDSMVLDICAVWLFPVQGA
ncbi:hypothetical protein F2Q70_00015000 [Brassica cretica]|uniref:Uncharacterized protein n=1 Tax=Brassica cretica TaxID=69181 RepID=A0A8S9HXK8_BRACR|nr:hypothetical protein F2Q70_00015000 [Brassica cretica]KAF2599550.1 hypothetical protein F2Q68_00008090 [Brassica cretica]